MNLRSGILALDIATQLGWCFGKPGGAPRYGTVRLGNGYGNGDLGASLMGWLSDAITVHDPGLIVYEAPLPGGAHKSPAAGRIALGLAMITDSVAHYRERKCREAHVMTVRKHVLGSGRASKEEMMAWCLNQGWTPDSLDASDACGVWRYGCDNHKFLIGA